MSAAAPPPQTPPANAGMTQAQTPDPGTAPPPPVQEAPPQTPEEAAEARRERLAAVLNAREDQRVAESRRDTAKLVGRIGLEAGLGILASAGSGGAAAPVTMGRLASLAHTALRARQGQLAVRGARAAAGEAAGSLASESFDPSEDPLKAAGTAALFGVGGEAVGTGLGRAFRGARGNNLVEGGRAALEIGEASGKQITPGLVSNSRTIDFLENVTASSFFGGPVVAAREGFVKATDDLIRNFTDTFGTIEGREGVESLVAETLAGRADAFKETGRLMYRAVDEATSEARVPIDSLVDLAEQIGSKNLMKDPKVAGLVSRIKALAPAPAEGAAKGAGKGATLSFEDAMIVRSALLGVGSGPNDLIAGAGTAAGKRLAARMDALMESAANRLGGDAKETWRAANRFWREGAGKFNDRLIKRLAKSDPGSLFSVGVKNQSPRTIRLLRQTIDDPDVWSEVQGAWLQKTLAESAPGLDPTEILSGKTLLRKLNAMGESAKELFPSGEIEGLRRLAKAQKIGQNVSVGRNVPGAVMIQLQQSGAALQLIGGGATAASAGITPAVVAFIGGPAVMAKLLTNKSFIRWATIGNQALPGTEKWLRAAGQLAAIALKEGAEMRTVRQDEPQPQPET